MKKERIIEILKSMIDWLGVKENRDDFKKDKCGLCHITKGLTDNRFEELLVSDFILSNTQRRYVNNEFYIFKPGNIEPRIKYLKQLIEMTEKNKAKILKFIN